MVDHRPSEDAVGCTVVSLRCFKIQLHNDAPDALFPVTYKLTDALRMVQHPINIWPEWYYCSPFPLWME